MKLWLVFSILVTTMDAVPRKVVMEKWKNFKDAYGKTYTDENEEMIRLKTFWNNNRIIQHHNRRFDKGKASYQLSMNHFGDLSESELKAYRGLRSNRDFTENVYDGAQSDQTDLPTNVDWRKKGAVTPVKNQGKCGSCYAFASIGALESHNYLSTGELISLSEQNAIDCTRPYGNAGCNGGYRYTIFEYVRDNGGIDTEESYSYQTIACDYCRYKPKYKTVNCTGYVSILGESESVLQSAVAHVGPVATGIDAHRSFHFYKSGIYYEPCCVSDSTSHAVLIVGYGTTDDGKDYWIIKNSWGEEWGEDGYVKMPRNLNNHCAVALTPCYPIVK